MRRTRPLSTSVTLAHVRELMAHATGDEKHEESSTSTLDALWVLYDRVLRIEELRRVLVPEGLLALCQPTREELEPDERAAWRALKAKLHTARFEIVEEKLDGAALLVANAARAAPVTQIRVRRPEHRARRISDVHELLSDLRAADPRRAHRHVVVPHRS